MSLSQAKRFYIILIALILSGWTLVITNHILMKSRTEFITSFCPVKTITGYPCPACGVGRGIEFLVNFDLIDAFLLNPFSIIVAIAGLIIPVWILRDIIKRNESLYWFNIKIGLWLKHNPLIIVILIIAVLGNWYWNLKKF